MARCSYHPNVETEMTCAECGKPICPKEMVSTPVGYKCPEDARPKRGEYTYVKPRQFVFAMLAGVGMGLLGGVTLSMVGWGGFFLGIAWGALTAGAVRRASGGHRGGTVAVAAVGGIVLGWLVFGVSFLAAIAAIVTALVQLAVIGDR